MSDDIHTCSASLLTPGVCCFSICTQRASQAVLIAQHGHLVEQARCHVHVHDHHESFVGVKPLAWDPAWGPKPDLQVWERRIGGTDIAETRLHLEVDPEGRIRVHEAVLVQLLVDAGWERTA